MEMRRLGRRNRKSRTILPNTLDDAEGVAVLRCESGGLFPTCWSDGEVRSARDTASCIQSATSKKVLGSHRAPLPDAMTYNRLQYITDATVDYLLRCMKHGGNTGDDDKQSFELDIVEVDYIPTGSRPTTQGHYRPIFVMSHLNELYEIATMVLMMMMMRKSRTNNDIRATFSGSGSDGGDRHHPRCT